MIKDIKVRSFYKFIALNTADLLNFQQEILNQAQRLEVRGLFLIASEGCNTTICGSSSSIDAFSEFVKTLLNLGELDFKDSFTKKHPYKRLKVEVRDEIVTFERSGFSIDKYRGTHLSPQRWHEMLKNRDEQAGKDGEEIILLDVRNWYESELGKFKGAIAPKIDKFTELPEFLDNTELPKDKNLLMYCTGGIRCEKAVAALVERGFNKVFQLEGGILKYLEEYPDGEFEGECFVFDHRVAVDQELQPSERFRLCPHCGDPGDVRIDCRHCGKEQVICSRCQPHQERQTCSKNCSYHYKLKIQEEKNQEEESRSCRA